MKLFIGLLGFIMTMLGVILALHLNFTIGLLITFGGVSMFWQMLPSTEPGWRRDEDDKLKHQNICLR